MADGLRKGLTSYGDAGFSLFSCARPSSRRWAIPTMRSPARSSASPTPTATTIPAHGNVPQIIEAVKRGVMLARRDADGGFRPSRSPKALRFRPRCILRNLMAMDTEEMIRGARPMDAVVVIGGLRQDLAGANHGGGQRRSGRRWSSRWGRWWSVTTRAKCSAPAPIGRRLWGKFPRRRNR